MATAGIGPLIINSPYEEPAEHWRYDRERRTFSLAGGETRPEDVGVDRKRTAGKIIDDRGIESLKIVEIK